jgi:hypothetical protein
MLFDLNMQLTVSKWLMLDFNEGKIVSVHTIKAHMGHRTNSLILNLSTRRSWVLNFSPQPPYSQ